MARLLRILALFALLAVALPVRAAPPAPGGPSYPRPAPAAPAPEGALQLELRLDPEPPGGSGALVWLRLVSEISLRGLEVVWEAPEGVAPAAGAPGSPAALAAGEAADWSYRVPLSEEGCGAFAVRAYARTADGAPVEAHLRGWLTPGPGGYEIKIDEPAEAAAAAPRAVEPLGGGGDPYEPDDDMAHATPLALGTTYGGHYFHLDGDVDWSRFNAVAGKSYAIELLNLGCQCEPRLELYTATSMLIHGELTRRFIRWTASSSGTYYVRVTALESAAFGTNTKYALRVRTFANAPDGREPDNSPTLAKPISLGTSYRHTFHTPADQDGSKVNVVAGRYYMADALNLGPWSRPVLGLFSDDGHGALTPVLEGYRHITWQAAYTGVYHVVARNDPGYASGDLFGPETHYDLRVRSFTPAKDAYEDDGAYTGAHVLGAGVRYRHNASTPSDTDWSAFTAIAGTPYRIELPYLGRYASGAWELTLFDNSLTELGGTSGTALAWTAPASGKYYVRMSHEPLAPCGPGSEYDILLEAPDSFEPDSTWDAATPLARESTSPPHSLLPNADQDWFFFHALAGKTYTLDALVSGWPRPELALFTSTGGGPIVSGGYHLVWRAPGAGSFLVRVSAGSHIHSYRLRLLTTSAPLDAYEPDDDAAHARPMALGTTYNHSYHRAYDPDWMRFHTTAGASYAVRGAAVGPYCEPAWYFLDSAFQKVYPNWYGSSVDWGWTAPDSGTYYVQSYNESASLFGAGSQYTLKVVKYTANPDSFEAGAGDNDHAHSQLYSPLGSRQAHTFHVSHDADWVSVYLMNTHQYLFETVSLGCPNDTVLTLYRPDGATYIGEDDDGGPGLASRLMWTADASGWYHVVVRRLGSLRYGKGMEYELRISDITT